MHLNNFHQKKKQSHFILGELVAAEEKQEQDKYEYQT